jgi:hypothetical protein
VLLLVDNLRLTDPACAINLASWLQGCNLRGNKGDMSKAPTTRRGFCSQNGYYLGTDASLLACLRRIPFIG